MFDDSVSALIQEDTALFVFTRLFYVGFSFMVSLVLLNILIAIMGKFVVSGGLTSKVDRSPQCRRTAS